MFDQIEVPSRPAIVKPGQMWLIEQAPATAAFACDRGALSGADVVLYDRWLETLLPALLPPGAYAEPLSATDAGGVLSPRALALAADGWSVAQLVAREAGRRVTLRSASALAALDAELPVILIAKMLPDRQRQWDASLRWLPRLIEECPAGDLLTLALGPLGTPNPGRSYAAASNGLAG